MAREELLVDTFVTLADTLIDDYDLIDFLQTLAERCVELLDVSAAGIMLADRNGQLRHIACSEERMRLVELFELQLEEGPCFDAYRDGSAVVCDTSEEVARQWPNFAPGAVEHGFVAVSAVPLRLRTQVIGSLNLFSSSPGALGSPDLRVAQAMADVATIGILQERAVSDARDMSAHLEHALHSRVAIEQAKGIIAARTNISVDAAFESIRAYARNHNELLRATAEQIIGGNLAAEQLADR
jgi:transcriptional regulator with GAF, ATPase, and Fis domain